MPKKSHTPTKQGFYWIENKKGDKIVGAVNLKGGLLLPGFEQVWTIEEAHAEGMRFLPGPIPVPK